MVSLTSPRPKIKIFGFATDSPKLCREWSLAIVWVWSVCTDKMGAYPLRFDFCQILIGGAKNRPNLGGLTAQICKVRPSKFAPHRKPTFDPLQHPPKVLNLGIPKNHDSLILGRGIVATCNNHEFWSEMAKIFRSPKWAG